MDEVPTTTRETSLEAVARLMVEEGARRVPVVDGRLEGIVTVTDVVSAIAHGEARGDAAVGDLASAVVTTTWLETPLPVVERQLSFADTPYAVVLDDGAEMTGIVTEVDIIEVARVVAGETDTGDSIANEDDEWMWEGIKAVGARYMPTRDVEIPAGPVSEFMTDEVVTVGRTRTAQEAAQLMLEHDVEQIPLISEGELAGIVLDMHLLEATYE
jgi:CBS domain-containing protein